jgi:rhodanese-related sulfurtransferase
MIKHASVQEAHQQQNTGATYLDVRSVPEFAQGHPAGAYNIPLLHLDPATRQMQPNPDFVSVVRSTFPPDTPLLVGCQAGARSLQAAQLLANAGFTNVTNVLGGFGGSRQGDVGWMQASLPTETTADPSREYDALSRQSAGGNAAPQSKTEGR